MQTKEQGLASRKPLDIVLRAVPLLLIAAPLSYAINTGIFKHKGVAAGPYVTAADIVVALLFIALIVTLFIAKDIRTFRWPTFLSVALFLWFLSGIFRRDIENVPVGLGPMLKESLQFLEYFVIGYIVFLTSLNTKRAIGIALDVLCSVLSVVVAFGLYHYFSGANPFDVRGTFENNAQLSAFVAVALPLVIANAIAAPGLMRKIWMLPLIAGSLLVVLNGWMFVGLSIGLIVLLSLYGRWAALAGTVFLFVLALVLFSVAPRNNASMLINSASIYHKDDTKMVPKGAEYRDFVVSARVRNWQAAINAAASKPLTGYAPSSYANAVKGEFYFDPKFPASTAEPAVYDIHVDEPSSFSSYMILLVEQGLIGLILFLLLALTVVRNGAIAVASTGSVGALGRGILASGIVFLFCAHFTSFLEKGLAFTAVFLMALSYAIYEYARGYRDE